MSGPEIGSRSGDNRQVQLGVARGVFEDCAYGARYDQGLVAIDLGVMERSLSTEIPRGYDASRSPIPNDKAKITFQDLRACSPKRLICAEYQMARRGSHWMHTSIGELSFDLLPVVERRIGGNYKVSVLDDENRTAEVRAELPFVSRDSENDAAFAPYIGARVSPRPHASEHTGDHGVISWPSICRDERKDCGHDSEVDRLRDVRRAFSNLFLKQK